MVLVGSDVVGLYPKYPFMKGESVAEESYQAVVESDIKWEGVDYKEGVRYRALKRSAQWCRTSRLRRVLPRRRYVKGTRPGVTGAGPLGPGNGDEEQWVFPRVAPTDLDKREIVAEIVRLVVETIFRTHLYSFGGKMYSRVRTKPG